MLQLCVYQDIEYLGSLESTREARVAFGATLWPLECSSNFPSTQYLDVRHLRMNYVIVK